MKKPKRPSFVELLKLPAISFEKALEIYNKPVFCMGCGVSLPPVGFNVTGDDPELRKYFQKEEDICFKCDNKKDAQ